ncbi:hypothetical protein QE152_g24803 [Popillia japonica]|uniref:Uncharacterized protein n=1 Tax=Popillia japonica TaxID=7064 RepID=A0AAW1K3Y6_POPJA
MNLKKLYAMYCSKVNENVKLSYFREFVNRNYNIGFGTPKTDVCSMCLRTEEFVEVLYPNIGNTVNIVSSVHVSS